GTGPGEESARHRVSLRGGGGWRATEGGVPGGTSDSTPDPKMFVFRTRVQKANVIDSLCPVKPERNAHSLTIHPVDRREKSASLHEAHDNPHHFTSCPKRDKIEQRRSLAVTSPPPAAPMFGMRTSR